MIPHPALALLLPAALLTWRWSRLVSGALWLTLATWLAYRGIRWQWPEMWAAGRIEWMRGVSAVTGLVGAVELRRRAIVRERGWYDENQAHLVLRSGRADSYAHALRIVEQEWHERWDRGRPDYLAALLVASMGVDLAAMLIHRGAGQWGPQPAFQCIVLAAMCAVSVWPRRK